MAKSKGAKKALDSYTVKGTHKVVKGKIEDLHTHSLAYIRILYSFHYMTLISYNTTTLDTKNRNRKHIHMQIHASLNWFYRLGMREL
jgi:hypothetical protein